MKEIARHAVLRFLAVLALIGCEKTPAPPSANPPATPSPAAADPGTPSPSPAGESTGDVEKILHIFGPDAERRNIRMDLQMSEKPLMVRGSEEILLEVFQNLLVNALEVSKSHDAVVVRASVTGSAGQRRVVVQVEDEGPGVPEEIQSKVFMPFFTTKQKGTGLGLAVVQRRVMDLAGEVTCLSPISAKGGTRFEVTLPLIEGRA